MLVGFIGLGRMGSAMARNLLRAGHTLIVYNRTRERAEPLVAKGARLASTPAAAGQADVLCTMLSDDGALEALTFGPDGILNHMRQGAVHVSHSTIGTSLARRLTEAHRNAGQRFVSAPVFGRPDAAAAAQLLIVAAGEDADLARIQPLFEAMGRRTVTAGSEPFQANAVKLAGNFMIAAMIEAFGEAFAAIRKSGVDPAAFLDAITGLFRSPVYENYGKMIAEARFEPAGFALRLGLKDAKLMLAAAEEVEAPMPLASLIRDHLLAALANGQEDLDWSSFVKVAARNAGLKD